MPRTTKRFTTTLGDLRRGSAVWPKFDGVDLKQKVTVEYVAVVKSEKRTGNGK